MGLFPWEFSYTPKYKALVFLYFPIFPYHAFQYPETFVSLNLSKFASHIHVMHYSRTYNSGDQELDNNGGEQDYLHNLYFSAERTKDWMHLRMKVEKKGAGHVS